MNWPLKGISRVRPLRLVLIGLMLAGLPVVGVVVGDAIRVRLWIRELHSADAAVRKRTLTSIAGAREARAADAVLALIPQEPDRDALELAGAAAVRIDDPRAASRLAERCDAGPDDAVRAKLIRYTARVSGGDLRLLGWLMDGVNAPEPWRRVGSAMGLLELGLTEGGQRLMEMAPGLPEDVSQFALSEFRAVAGPMGVAIGRPLLPCDPKNAAEVTSCWAELAAFWDRYATLQLLSDCLARMERFDPAWREVNRLRHAREYAARVLN